MSFCGFNGNYIHAGKVICGVRLRCLKYNHSFRSQLLKRRCHEVWNKSPQFESKNVFKLWSQGQSLGIHLLHLILRSCMTCAYRFSLKIRALYQILTSTYSLKHYTMLLNKFGLYILSRYSHMHLLSLIQCQYLCTKCASRTQTALRRRRHWLIAASTIDRPNCTHSSIRCVLS